MRRFATILIFTCACNFVQAQVNIITTIAGIGTQGYSGDNGPATNAEFNHANQLCLDNFGNLYISDAFNNRVRKITLVTGIITTVAGNGTGGFSGDGAQATNAQLLIPDAVCTDTLGNIYIADGINHRIRKVDIFTGVITTIVGSGVSGNSGDGAAATNAQIASPSGLSIDKYGNIYLADIDNNNIRKVTPAGIISTVAGNGTLGYSGDGGSATNAQLSSPGDIGIDSFGHIIISDNHNHAVRKVDVLTGIITTIAGDGTPGYFGDGGAAVNSRMRNPYGVFIDGHNDIFVVESGNGIVRKIEGSTGIISTVVGCGTLGFSGDGGPATNAQLQPDDIVLDKHGTMFIADYKNNRIRMVYNPQLNVQPNILRNETVVYPNPSQNELTIENAEGSEAKIYNMLGQEVYATFLSSKKQILNLERISSGMYVVEVLNISKNLRKKERLVISK